MAREYSNVTLQEHNDSVMLQFSLIFLKITYLRNVNLGCYITNFEITTIKCQSVSEDKILPDLTKQQTQPSFALKQNKVVDLVNFNLIL